MYAVNVERSSLRSQHLFVHPISHSVENPYECNQCGETFIHQWVVRLHQRIHSGEKLCICTDVGRLLSQRPTWLHIKKFIVERSHMNTVTMGHLSLPNHNVGRSSPKDQTSLYTRSFGLDKELMFMLNVEGPSLRSQSWWHIREFILVKNFMNAVTVVKSLHRSHTSLYTWMFILAGNLPYVLNEKHPELPMTTLVTPPHSSLMLSYLWYLTNLPDFPSPALVYLRRGLFYPELSPSPIIVSLRR